MPKVTIIMATYNRAHFIFETLLSVQNQSFKNFECIIIDDGGDDNTVEVITPILKEDNRFLFFKRPEKYKKGLPGCRNFGLDNAKGDFIIFFDDDDIVHPKLLQTVFYVLKDVNSIDFVHYKKQSFTNKFNYSNFNKPLILEVENINERIYEDVILGNLPLASCTVLWKKDVFKNHKFNENLQYAEEWELYSRILLEQDLIGVKLNNALYFNRKHSASNTGEFWNNNPIRINSKKEALQIIVRTVLKSKKLTVSLFRYFVREAYVYKLPNITKEIFKNKKTINMVIYKFLFPIRFKIFKNLQKLKS